MGDRHPVSMAEAESELQRFLHQQTPPLWQIACLDSATSRGMTPPRRSGPPLINPGKSIIVVLLLHRPRHAAREASQYPETTITTLLSLSSQLTTNKALQSWIIASLDPATSRRGTGLGTMSWRVRKVSDDLDE